MDNQKRKEATDFLLTQCEPDPQFQLALLHIIKQSAGNAQKSTIQYQAILCMKNSLKRLLNDDRKNRLFKTQKQQALSEEMRERIKSELLAICRVSDEVLDRNAFEQLTLVIAIFWKLDFPAKWPEMNEYLLGTMKDLLGNLENLG